MAEESIKDICVFKTEYQNDEISGMLVWHDHLLIAHNRHDVIYIYDKEMQLKHSVKVSDMCNPMGLCMIQVEGGTQYLVVVDSFNECLWWLRVEEQADQMTLVDPLKHKLGYEATNVVTDTTGRALVCDYHNSNLYMYSEPLEAGICVQLSDGIKPWGAVSHPSGGYIVSDTNYTLLWVDSAGQVKCCYDDQPPVSAWYILNRGADLFVVDCFENCVHVVTGVGKHCGYLLTEKQHKVKKPRRICMNTDRKHIWLCHTGEEKTKEVIKLKYSSNTTNRK